MLLNDGHIVVSWTFLWVFDALSHLILSLQ